MEKLLLTRKEAADALNISVDTLDEIRKGFTAYIFNLEQVAEVFRYEPKARIIYLEKEDCFAVRL